MLLETGSSRQAATLNFEELGAFLAQAEADAPPRTGKRPQLASEDAGFTIGLLFAVPASLGFWLGLGLIVRTCLG